MPIAYPRCDTTTCARCRRKLATADRVIVVNIVERVGVNPSNMQQQGAWLTGEFELVHFCCDDPTLDTTITIR